jgi:hypothetical protein
MGSLTASGTPGRPPTPGCRPVEGEDAVFEPLRPEEGRWYGGGRTYTLTELVDHQQLAYTYDTLFKP